MSRSVWASAATSADADGWLVVPAIGARGDVDGVDARVHCGEQGGELATGGVVGVQVHRQVEPLPQRRDRVFAAAAGRSRPAMSLMARTCAPASTICSARRR